MNKFKVLEDEVSQFAPSMSACRRTVMRADLSIDISERLRLMACACFPVEGSPFEWQTLNRVPQSGPVKNMFF